MSPPMPAIARIPAPSENVSSAIDTRTNDQRMRHGAVVAVAVVVVVAVVSSSVAVVVAVAVVSSSVAFCWKFLLLAENREEPRMLGGCRVECRLSVQNRNHKAIRSHPGCCSFFVSFWMVRFVTPVSRFVARTGFVLSACLGLMLR